MEEDIRKAARPHDGRPGSFGALIHAAVRRAIEVAVEEELTAALGAVRYARDSGYRNGHRSRTVTGPTGPLALRTTNVIERLHEEFRRRVKT